MPAACRMWPAAIAPAEFRPTIKPTARPRATALTASAPICLWRRIFCIAASFPDHPPEIVSPQGWTAGHGHGVPDAIFTHPRLAAIYDAFDGPRGDLAAYASIAEELGAHRVLDVGCGTGCLALLLARSGHAVVAVDPATASLEVARSKDESAAVNWIQGDAAQLPAVGADLAVMTGNTSQRPSTHKIGRRLLRLGADEFRAAHRSSPQGRRCPCARRKGVPMGQPVVHFEIIGKDPAHLRNYYSQLFGWEFDTSSPVADAVSEPDNYGFVSRATTSDGTGIPGGVGGGGRYHPHVLFYVEFPMS